MPNIDTCYLSKIKRSAIPRLTDELLYIFLILSSGNLLTLEEKIELTHKRDELADQIYNLRKEIIQKCQ